MIKDQQGREIFVETEDGRHRPATEAEHNGALAISLRRAHLENIIKEAQRELASLLMAHGDNRVFFDDHGSAGTLRNFIAMGKVDLI